MNGKHQTLTTVLLSTAVLGTLTAAPFLELQVKAQVTHRGNQTATQLKTARTTVLQTGSSVTNQAIADQLAGKGVNYTQLSAAKRQQVYVDVIVQLNAAPATENGTVNTQTSSTAEIQAATQKVIAAQKSVKARVAAITHQGVGDSYGYVVNGFTTQVKVKDIAKLQQVTGVKSVTVAKAYHPADASANDMAHVSTVWSNYKYKGQGTVVAIIDTGIDPTHKDLRLSDAKTAKLSHAAVDAFTQKAGYGRYYTDKVPYGHNYADNNEIIKDNTVDEQHGMHVAGIVGANGTGTDHLKSVTGVAPEAQLLAMKAFSNSASSASTDSTSVIAAVEDSSKLGADVLNLSLGSTSGEQTHDDPEIAAIDHAVDSGTAAVISAGNSGSSGSDQTGDNTDNYGNPDVETVGSPGTSRQATTVSSAENTNAIDDAITMTAAGKTLLGPSATETSTDSDLKALSGQEYYVAKDASGKLATGNPKDFTAAAKGKVAVVARGDIAFAAKQANAKAAGAVGIIIVNNAGGDAPLTSVQYTAGFPTAGLSTQDGDKLLAYLKQNPTAKLDVIIAKAEMKNTLLETDKLSTFTSYGPVSDLAFKPDITAPGGNIWSTQNDNGYMNMSGTSMASPFIAGSQALLTQAMTDKSGAFYAQYQAMNGTQRANFMKTIEMNTAKSVDDVTHDNVPESPRRQGAGQVDVNAAITALTKNPSTVTGANDYPGVELKAFTGNTHTFSLKFTNWTKRALTYTLDNSDAKQSAVYTSATDPKTKQLYERAINGASIKNDEPITIPAGTTKTINFTLNLPAGFSTEQYVEGFLAFKGSDDSKLSIPYMGFYGNWGQPAIFDSLNGVTFSPKTGNLGTIVNAGNAKHGESGHAGLTQDAKGNYSVDPNKIALSTAKGAAVNWLRPEYETFRNANNVKAQILNKKGKLLTQLAVFHSVTKTYWEATTAKYIKFDDAPKWDGTYYDAKQNAYKQVPDGTYIYRVSGTVDGTQTTQHYDIKIKVDSVKPQAQNVKLVKAHDAKGKATYALTLNAKDNFSGLDDSIVTTVNGVRHTGTATTTGTAKNGFKHLKVLLSAKQAAAVATGRNNLRAVVSDNASNQTKVTGQAQKPGAKAAKQTPLLIDRGGLPKMISTTTSGYHATKTAGQYTISGTYANQPAGTYTDAQGKRHTLTFSFNAKTQTFSGKLPLTVKDYRTTVTLYGDKAHHDKLTSKRIQVSLVPAKVVKLAVDGKTTYSAAKQAQPKLNQSAAESTTITGTVSADTKTLTYLQDGQPVKVAITKQHTFSVDLPLNYGTNQFAFTATDSQGNASTTTQTVKSTTQGVIAKTDTAVSFKHGIVFGTNSVNLKTKNYDAKTGILKVQGRVAANSTTLEVANQPVAIKKNHTFTLNLHVGRHASATFPVMVSDRTGKTLVQDRLTFYVDGNRPTVTLNATKRHGKYAPIHTSAATYTIHGTIKDDFPYYRLYVNNNEVGTMNDDVDMNGNTPLDKTFSETVSLKQGKNVFTVKAKDIGDNVSTKQVLTIYRK